MTLHQNDDGMWSWTCHHCTASGDGFGLQHGALFAAVRHINAEHPDIGDEGER